ncbi:MAG: type II secretion system F family protein [bacterium]
MIRGTTRVGIEAQSRFFRSTGAMLGAGMPLVSCLRLGETQAGGKLVAVARLLREKVEGGLTLSGAMASLPGTFDAVTVGMIRAAESSGKLPEAMLRIADMKDATAKLLKRVRAAMVYPAVLLAAALGVSWFLSMFILPVLAGLLENRPAPLPTRMVMGFGAWMTGLGGIAPAVIMGAGILLGLAGRTRRGARFFNACLLRVPVAGGLARKVAVARFARVYGSLLQGGVPVLRALELSAAAAGDNAIGDAILRSRGVVGNGEPLSAALAGEKSIPAELVGMLVSGEKSGRIDEMLDSMAGYYEHEVETTLGMLPALIQPVLIVIAGIIVLFIILSVFLPILGLIENIGA